MADATRRMFRYVVPVDDQAHGFGLQGDPVAVAASPATVADPGSVEFWAEHITPHGHLMVRSFRVFGTGQMLPRNARWVGTCPRTVLGLVWHLYEMDGDG